MHPHLIKRLHAAIAQTDGAPSSWPIVREGEWPLVDAQTEQPAKRGPLTVERISELWESHKVPLFGEKVGVNPIVFARAIEAEITKGQQ